MIYFKEEYVTICYDAKLKLVEVIWTGMVFSDQFRESMEMILDLLEDKQAESFLIDRKKMQRISLVDEAWRKEHWFPRFLRSTVKRSASVISKDYYNEVSVARLIEEKDAELKIERRSFYSYQEAKTWLIKSVVQENKQKWPKA